MLVADPLETAWFPLSDFGNAKRLVKVAAGELLWVADLERWASFDGTRWSLERGAIEALALAQKVVEHIREEVRELDRIAADEQLLKNRYRSAHTVKGAKRQVADLRGHFIRSGSAGMTAGMLKQARPMLTAMLDEFDSDPLAYNCLNATLRFVRRDGEAWKLVARPHDPQDKIMRVANVEYRPDEKCAFWMERIQMLNPDPEQVRALQLLYGYTLTGLTSDQAFYVHQGRGGDGKSATHMTLADLHGSYSSHAGVKTFLQSADRGGAEHRSDLVRLAGDVRFVTCDEPKARSVWDGEIIKQVTGSHITARGSYAKNEITFKPRFKLFIECNNIPRAPSDDKGFRRRFKLYQWRVSLPEPGEKRYEPIDVVLERLASEKSGILNWMIAGCLNWLATRVIPQPKAMDDVLKDYWVDSSPLLEWINEWCDLSDRNAMTAFSELYDNYKKWCEANSIEHPMTSTAFGRALRDRQHAMVKDSRGVRWRKGIKLRDEGFFGDSAIAAPPGCSPARSADSGGKADGTRTSDALDRP